MTSPSARVALVAVLGLAACGGGDGGDGDAGDDASPVDASGDRPITMADLLDACVTYFGCFGYGDISECIEGWPGAAPPATIHCIADAAGCGPALACLGITLSVSAPCTDEACVGTSAVSCLPGYRYERDCAVSGQVCADGPDGSYCAEPCTATTCEGGVLDRCRESDLYCELLGWTCDLAGPRCSDGTATACAIGSSRCDGAALIDCIDGFEMRLDCDRLIAGSTCRTFGSGASFCGFGEACGVADQAVCTGTTLSLCARGELLTLDCTAYGFSTCGDGSCAP